MSFVTLIAGPPCAGKTTLAHHLAEPGDLVLDFDQIAVQLGSPHLWNHSPLFITATEQRIGLALRERGERTVWLIRAAPRPAPSASASLEHSARGSGCSTPGQKECLRRARRRPNAGRTALEIRKWYRLYAPSPIDEAPGVA